MTFSIAIRTVPKRFPLFSELFYRAACMIMDDSVLGMNISANPEVAPNENGCRALEGAAAFGADWVIFLEDDAGLIHSFLPNVKWWIGNHAQDDVHIYPLGCQYDHWEPGATAWKYPIPMFYCSVAMIIRGTQVPSLVAYFRQNSHVAQGFDLMSGHWHESISKSPCLLTPIPCLVEHLGDDSTLIEGRPERNVVGRFRGFKGYDFSYVG